MTMNTEELEIDLKSFLKKLLLQWKPLLCTGLVFALLLMGYRYIRDKSALSKEAAVAEESEEELKDHLSEEELLNVEDAVYYRTRIALLDAYTDMSPLMSVDPYAKRAVTLLYQIETKGEIQSVLAQYKAYLSSLDFAEALTGKTDLSSDAKNLSALLSIETEASVDPKLLGLSGGGNGTLTISFLLPEGSDADMVSQTVQGLVSDYTDTLTGSQAELLSATERETVDMDLQRTKQGLRADKNSFSRALWTLETAFSADQIRYYEERLAEEQVPFDEEQILERAGLSELPETASSGTPSVHFSKKYFLLGFAVGLVLYVIALFLYEVFRKRVSDVMPAEGVPMLGQIRERELQGNRFLNSALIYRLYERKRKAVENQIHDTAENIRFAVESRQEEKVTLVSAGELKHKDYATRLTEEKKGVLLSYESLETKEKDLLYEKLRELKGSVVLAVENGSTSYRSLAELFALFIENGNEVLGMVLFG